MLADLVHESWVLRPSESVVGALSKEAFRVSGLDHPRVTVVTDFPEVRMSLLATGRFLTIVPASALRFPTKRSEIKILPVELPVAPVANEIVTLKNRTLSPVAKLFIEHAHDGVSDEVEQDLRQAAFVAAARGQPKRVFAN